jgi:hypothetical protein
LRFLLSISRVAGIVVLVIAASWATIALATHQFASAGLGFAVAAGGLCWAIFSEKAIDRRKRNAEKEASQAALGFSGSSLTVPFRWLRWTCIFTAVFLILWGAGFLAKESWQSGKLVPTAFLVGLGVLVFAHMCSLLACAYAAWRSGGALKVDLTGFMFSGLPAIAWKHVRGVDLKQFEVKGRKKSVLMLALEPAMFDQLKPARVPGALHWTGPQWKAKSRLLEIGCDFLKEDPELVARAVQVVADKAGAPRAQGWHHFEGIDVALEREQAAGLRREADRKTSLLLAELQKMDRAGAMDEKRLAEIDRQLQVEFERMSSATDAQVEAFKHKRDVMDERLKPLKWFYRGMVVLLLVAIGGAVARIFFALKH